MVHRARPVRSVKSKSSWGHGLRHKSYAFMDGCKRWIKRTLVVFLAVTSLGGVSVTALHYGYGTEFPQLVASWDGVVERVSRSLGWTVKVVHVSGGTKVTLADILKVCPFKKGEGMFVCSPEEAREKVMTLPWVASVTVQRKLPHTVMLHIVERHPLAIWDHDNKKRLMDVTGHVFAPASSAFKGLPVVMGEEASRHAPSFLKTLQAYPSVQKHLEIAVYVPSQRWYLVLKPSIYVYLPYDYTQGLERLEDLIKRHKMLERDIQGVDLRVEDKLFFHLTPRAQERLRPAGSHV